MKTTHAVLLVVLAVIAGGILFVHLRNPSAFGFGQSAPSPAPAVASKPTLPAKLAAPAVNAIQAAHAKVAEALDEKPTPAQVKTASIVTPEASKPATIAPNPAPVVAPQASTVVPQPPVSQPDQAPTAPWATTAMPLPPTPSSAISSSSVMNAPSDVLNTPAESATPAPATSSAPMLPSDGSTPIMSAAPTASGSVTAAAWTPPSPTPAQPNWTWTTTDGHVYRKVKVLKMDPQAITILYQDGGANVPMETLPPDLQKLFNYNPDAAAQWGVGKLVAGYLVALRNDSIEPVKDAELRPARYIAIYYSAAWCPPCHLFTPQLVKFYNGFKPIHSDFEIIFVSEDRDPLQMAVYMREMKMPWLAVSYSALVHPPGTFKASGIEAFAGDGIPDLVLLDATGKVLLDSYRNGKYIGPESVMNDIPSIVK